MQSRLYELKKSVVTGIDFRKNVMKPLIGAAFMEEGVGTPCVSCSIFIHQMSENFVGLLEDRKHSYCVNRNDFYI